MFSVMYYNKAQQQIAAITGRTFDKGVYKMLQLDSLEGITGRTR